MCTDIDWCISTYLLSMERYINAMGICCSRRCTDSTMNSIRRWVSCRTCRRSCRRTYRSRILLTTSTRKRLPHLLHLQCFRIRHYLICLRSRTLPRGLQLWNLQSKSSRLARWTALPHHLHRRPSLTLQYSTIALHLRRRLPHRLTKTMTPFRFHLRHR